MNLTEHGVMEIDYLHLEDKEKEEYLKKFVGEFLKEFGEQGHSNNSAPFAISAFKQYTEGKNFIDKELKDIIGKPKECEDDNPDTWMEHDVYQLVSTYHKLVNTEEFVAYEIDEDYIKNILYRLMNWKPISPLQGTPDEWYTGKIINEETGESDGIIGKDGSVQNRRYSSIFAEDNTGRNAYNIRGKIFKQNGLYFSSKDSIVPVTFPYEVPDKEEVVELEDYIPLENAPTYFIKFKYLDGSNDLGEYTIGYKKSTLDTSINHEFFYKADFCVLTRYNSNNDDKWYVQEEYDDMPIYMVRMKSRLKEYIKHEFKHRNQVIEGVFLNKECTISAEL